VFIKLPVLTETKNRCPEENRLIIADLVFVCVQHLLSTNGSLFKELINLGANPLNIFLLGKCYSTNDITFNRLANLGINVRRGEKPKQYGEFSLTMQTEVEVLWSNVKREIKRLPQRGLVVIDDGGQCLKSIPNWAYEHWKVIGIEQTTSGLKPIGVVKGPVIEVAACAAKCIIEPPMIAHAVTSRIKALLQTSQFRKCGVVGFGNIGSALAETLYEDGYDTSVYDLKKLDIPPYLHNNSNIRSLISHCEVVFGCTGQDIIRSPEPILENLSGTKLFMSCSSGDREFLKLLSYKKFLAKDLAPDTLGSVSMRYPPNSGPNIVIARGGFPVNFDGEEESVPASDIQMTRGLMLGAIIQGSSYFINVNKMPEGRKMLSPFIQKTIVKHWNLNRKNTCFQANDIEKFNDTKWIESCSSGSYDEFFSLQSHYSCSNN
jgi:hypothetical protein